MYRSFWQASGLVRLPAASSGTLSDFIGTILFPTAGAYYPPLTIAFSLIGFVAGFLPLLVKSKRAFLRAAMIVIPAELAGSYLFKSFALSMLIGVPFPVLLATRALPVGIVMTVNTILVAFLDRLLRDKALGESRIGRIRLSSH